MSHVLTLNAGSSTLKFALYRVAEEPALEVVGKVDRIGGEAELRIGASGGAPAQSLALEGEQAASHAGALRATLDAVEARFPDADIVAVGHRIVHGGTAHADPVLLTDAILSDLKALIPFAPLHQPHNLAGVEAARAEFPEAQQIGCFDTAFHRGQPFESDAFALPRSYFDEGVRRYGFHGLSYDYISGAMATLDPELRKGKVAVAHLGNGASICAIVDGKSVASTMGFTALDGLAMGTRCGQLDPGVVLYMLEQKGMTASEITSVLYKKSGLLGLSGISHDMRELLASDAPEAAQAVDYFCARIRHEIAGLVAAMEGIDGIVFTGGIGEHAAPVRRSVCEGLAWLGVSLDPKANAASAPVISTPDSALTVRVIPTNEELVIARATCALGVT